MIKITKNNINLYDTITCGQIFRYEVIDNKYILVLNDRVVELYEDDSYVYITSSNETNLKEYIYNYFDLNRDYNEINNILIKNDNTLKPIIELCNGFKIINQNPFETMVSYIISANNNVRNIQSSVNLISKNYGKKIIFNNKEYYLFPNLNDMKRISIDEYKNMKLGFRSKYVYDFVNNITEEDIYNISNLSTEDALNYLMNYKGIGLKIASCILLFSYSRFDVFPIDTWVKKYMIDKYNIKNIKEIEEFTKDKYDCYSGLVIQYFFHTNRNRKDL